MLLLALPHHMEICLLSGTLWIVWRWKWIKGWKLKVVRSSSSSFQNLSKQKLSCRNAHLPNECVLISGRIENTTICFLLPHWGSGTYILLPTNVCCNKLPTFYVQPDIKSEYQSVSTHELPLVIRTPTQYANHGTWNCRGLDQHTLCISTRHPEPSKFSPTNFVAHHVRWSRGRRL